VTAAWQDRVPTLRERRPVMAQPRRARTDRQRAGWSRGACLIWGKNIQPGSLGASSRV
jgi:hypothetical protein